MAAGNLLVDDMEGLPSCSLGAEEHASRDAIHARALRWYPLMVQAKPASSIPCCPSVC